MPAVIPIALGVSAATAVAGTVMTANAQSNANSIASRAQGTQAQIAAMGMNASQNAQQQQAYYNQMLQQLVQSPDSFTQSGLFQGAMNAVTRSQAAQGYLGSTNEVGALQSQAMQQLFQQEGFLGQMSGQFGNQAAQDLGLSSGATQAGSQAALAANGQVMQGNEAMVNNITGGLGSLMFGHYLMSQPAAGSGGGGGYWPGYGGGGGGGFPLAAPTSYAPIQA